MCQRSVLPRFVVCLIVLTCASALAWSGDWSFDQRAKQTSIWAGFGVGTMVHHRVVTEMRVEGSSAGGRKSQTETKMTLVEITESEFVVKVEELESGRWRVTEVREPRSGAVPDARLKVEREGEDSVVIGGQSYPCTKRKVSDVDSVIDDPMRRAESVASGEQKPGRVWEHDTLGVLKVETIETGGAQAVTTTQVVTRLDVTHEVKGRALACREMTWTTSALGGKTIRLESAAVPGRTVLTKGEVSQGPITMTHVKELIGLVTKPEAGD